MTKGPPRAMRSHTLLQLLHSGTSSWAVPATDSDMAERKGRGMPSRATRTCLEAVWLSLTWCTLPAKPRPASSSEDEREDPKEGV